MLGCMRKVPMEKMVEVSYGYAQELHPPFGFFTFIAGNDGEFLVDRPSNVLHEGKFVKGIPTILAWTADEGTMLTGLAPLVQTQDDIWTVLADWNGPSLSEEEKAHLLEAYPVSEFEASAAAYNAHKAPESPALTRYWYQVSSFLRDMLFACGSMDMAYHMQKHSHSTKRNFDNYWLYQLNQTMLGPMFGSIGMDYVGTVHGSDISYIFNGVFPEGVVSEADLKLARKMAASIISFANTGSPVSSEGFSSWPKALEGVVGVNNQTDVMPSEINILSVGGPHGTVPVRISHAAEAAADAEGDYGAEESTLCDRAAERLGDVQQDVLGTMKSREASFAQQAIEKQKLFRRCEYVNSTLDGLGG